MARGEGGGGGGRARGPGGRRCCNGKVYLTYETLLRVILPALLPKHAFAALFKRVARLRSKPQTVLPPTVAPTQWLPKGWMRSKSWATERVPEQILSQGAAPELALERAPELALKLMSGLALDRAARLS